MITAILGEIKNNPEFLVTIAISLVICTMVGVTFFAVKEELEFQEEEEKNND